MAATFVVRRPKPPQLRDKDLEGLRLIAAFHQRHRKMPTHAEIAELIEASHPNMGTKLIERLERLGLVTRARRGRRGTVITAEGRRAIGSLKMTRPFR